MFSPVMKTIRTHAAPMPSLEGLRMLAPVHGHRLTATRH